LNIILKAKPIKVPDILYTSGMAPDACEKDGNIKYTV
jgi:hypothetical protein